MYKYHWECILYKYHFSMFWYWYMVDTDKKFFKVLFSPDHCLHCLLPPVKSNPYELRSRDHNFLLLYAVFIDLNRFWLSFLHVFLTASSYFFHMHVLLFIWLFCAIAIFTALNSVACKFVTCYSINTQILNTLHQYLYTNDNVNCPVAYHRLNIQEAQLSPRDRAMRRVSWNLANCHATVQYDKSWTNWSYEVGGLRWADV